MSESVKDGSTGAESRIPEGANSSESKPSEGIEVIKVGKLAMQNENEKATASKEVFADEVNEATENEDSSINDSCDPTPQSSPVKKPNVMPDITEGANENVEPDEEVSLDVPSKLPEEIAPIEQSTAQANTEEKGNPDDAVPFKEPTQGVSVEEMHAMSNITKQANKNEDAQPVEAVSYKEPVKQLRVMPDLTEGANRCVDVPAEEVSFSERCELSTLCAPLTSSVMDSIAVGETTEATSCVEEIEVSKDVLESTENGNKNEKVEANGVKNNPSITAAIKDSIVTTEINEEVSAFENQPKNRESSFNKPTEETASATPTVANDILVPENIKKANEIKIPTPNEITGEANENESLKENVQEDLLTQTTFSAAPVKDANMVTAITDDAYKDEELTESGKVSLKERNEHAPDMKEITAKTKKNETPATGETVILSDADELAECVASVGANLIVENEVTEEESELLKISPQVNVKRKRLVVENDGNYDKTCKKPRKCSPPRNLYTVLKPPKDEESDAYALEIAHRIKQRLPPSISVSVKQPTDIENNTDISKEENTIKLQSSEKQSSLPSSHTNVRPTTTTTSKSSITDALRPPIAPISIPVTQIPGSAYNSLVCTSITSKSSSTTNSKGSDPITSIAANENERATVITTKPSSKVTILYPRTSNPTAIKTVKVVPRSFVGFPTKSSNSFNENKALITSIKILPLNPALLKVASNAERSKNLAATSMVTAPIANNGDLATTSDSNTSTLDNIPTLQHEEDQNDIEHNAEFYPDTMPSFSHSYLKSLSDYIREAKAYNAATVGKKNETDRSNKSENIAATLEDIETDLITYEIFNKESDNKVNANGRNMSTQTNDTITNILSKIQALKEKTSQQAEDIVSLKAAMKLLNSTIGVKNISLKH